MKRLLALLLCLCLGLAGMLSACAEDTETAEAEQTAYTARDAEVFTLYWDGRPIADAVAALRMEDSVFLVTSADALPSANAMMNAAPLSTMDQRLGAMQGIWKVDLTPLAMIAFEMKTPIATLNDFPYAGLPTWCAGTLLQDNYYGYATHDLDHRSTVTLDGVNGWTFFTSAGYLPGCQLLDDEGYISGIILSAWGEGAGRYFAVSAESIMDALAENELTEIVLDGLPFSQEELGIVFDYDGGILTIDLNDFPLTEAQSAETLRVYVNASPNQYHEWRDFEPGENRVMRVMMPPDTDIAVLVSQGEGDDEVTLALQPWETPLIGFMDRYDYNDSECYLGAVPAGETLADDAAAPAAGTLTVDELFGGERQFFFQMISTYQVDSETREPLLLVLTAPDGQFFCEAGTFIYIPELQEGDVWHFNLANILTLCEEFAGRLPGTYNLTYYLDGAIGGLIEVEVSE